MKGSVYIEILVVLPIFFLLFLGVRYVGKGFYLSSYAWGTVLECVRYEGCNWNGNQRNVDVSSISSFLNEIAGTVGKEISVDYYEKVIERNIEIKAVNYTTLNTWNSQTREGWIFGGGLVLLGFIKGFSGSEEVKDIGEKIIPDFSEEKLRRFLDEVERRS